MVGLLLLHGADPGLLNAEGRTALQVAASQDIMKLLFDFTAKYLEIRYLYLQVFNGLKLTFMTQTISKTSFLYLWNISQSFCHIYNTFLRENP